MIETFYNQTVTQLRRSTPSPTASDSITTVSSFSCLIRPVTDLSKLYIASNSGKEYDLVCNGLQTIRVGDQIVEDKNYSVLGVSKYTDLENDVDSHLNVRLVANE